MPKLIDIKRKDVERKLSESQRDNLMNEQQRLDGTYTNLLRRAYIHTYTYISFIYTR